METEKEPYRKFRPLFITSELRSSILKKGMFHSISLFSGIPRIFKLALSSGILSKYDLAYRILLFHSQNTPKPKLTLFFQGCGRHSSFKSDSWFYKAWRSFPLLHHRQESICWILIFFAMVMCSMIETYKRNPFLLNFLTKISKAKSLKWKEDVFKT